MSLRTEADFQQSNNKRGTVKIGLIQHDINVDDVAATIAAVDEQVREAVDEGAEAVVLAEFWATGYHRDPSRIAEPIGGPIQQHMEQLAAELGIVIFATVAVNDQGRYFNRMCVTGPEGTIATYDKRQLFSYADEHLRYTPGHQSVTVEVRGLSVTPLVCYDLRFGPLFWTQALSTDCYVISANWPDPRLEHWTALLTARAIENQAWVIGVNRVGQLDGLTFRGGSAVVDPWGVVRELPNGPNVLVVEVDAQLVSSTRRAFPVLNDWHPDRG